MEQIIKSVLDTDTYTFTVGQLAFMQYYGLNVKYKFFNRKGTKFPEGFSEMLKNQLLAMEDLCFTREDSFVLARKIPALKDAYFDSLIGYKPFKRWREDLTISQDGGDLSIDIEGWWRESVFWEVPLLALISELYYKMTDSRPTSEIEVSAESKFYEKSDTLEALNFFSEFGTRRRYSFANQDSLLKFMIYENVRGLAGTSNVFLANKHRIEAIGTMSHQVYQAHQALYGVRSANFEAMKAWLREFNGKLSIMLPDTYGTDMFLHIFNGYYARLCDGIRQDSGSPFEIGRGIIHHYETLGIDPKTKKIIFSDGLTPKIAYDLQKYFEGRIKVAFGIGTNLSNDVGVAPLSIVIKAVSFGGVPVVKLSDSVGKYTGKKEDIDHALYEVHQTLDGDRRF